MYIEPGSPGRTPRAMPSTAACVTICSTSKSSVPSRKARNVISAWTGRIQHLSDRTGLAVGSRRRVRQTLGTGDNTRAPEARTQVLRDALERIGRGRLPRGTGWRRTAGRVDMAGRGPKLLRTVVVCLCLGTHADDARVPVVLNPEPAVLGYDSALVVEGTLTDTGARQGRGECLNVGAGSRGVFL